MGIRSKLSVLVQLAGIDGEFAGIEKSQIYIIGKANGFKESEIDELLENPESMPQLGTMTDDERFEYLYDLVQLMKIDSRVYLSEIKFCEEMAEKLGFKKRVISNLSARVYSDPSITSDMASLKKEVKKYQR